MYVLLLDVFNGLEPFVNLGIGIGIGTDITNAIIFSSIRPLDLNLAGWSLRLRGRHPQSHVTLRHCGHMTNKKTVYLCFHKTCGPQT